MKVTDDDLEHDHISNYEVSDDYAEKYLRRVPGVKVALTRWRDARTERPALPGYYPTDLGVMWIGPRGAWRLSPDDEPGPQPSVWCDPVPPDEDGLTTDDLEEIEYVLGATTRNIVRSHYLAARLRRALAADKETT